MGGTSLQTTQDLCRRHPWAALCCHRWYLSAVLSASVFAPGQESGLDRDHTEVTEQPFTEYKALSVSNSRISYVPRSPVRWVEHFHGIFSAPLAVLIGLGRSQGER